MKTVSDIWRSTVYLQVKKKKNAVKGSLLHGPSVPLGKGNLRERADEKNENGERWMKGKRSSKRRRRRRRRRRNMPEGKPSKAGKVSWETFELCFFLQRLPFAR